MRYLSMLLALLLSWCSLHATAYSNRRNLCVMMGCPQSAVSQGRCVEHSQHKKKRRRWTPSKTAVAPRVQDNVRESEFPFKQLPLGLQEKVIGSLIYKHPDMLHGLSTFSPGVRLHTLEILEKHPKLLAPAIPGLLVQHPQWKPYVAYLLARDSTLGAELLSKNSRRWSNEVLRSGPSASFPGYWQEVAQVEGLLLQSFLQDKQFDTVTEWKKHAVAIILAFYAIYQEAYVSVSGAVEEAAWMSSANNSGALLREANTAAKSAGWFVGKSLLFRMILATPDAVARARHAVRTTVQEAVGSKVYAEARLAADALANRLHVFRLRSSVDLGRDMYRAAELYAWLELLEPRHDVFAKVYAAAYAEVDVLSLTMLQSWWNAPADFERELQHRLVHPARHNARASMLLSPLVEELRRVGAHIFAADTQMQR